MPLGRSSAASLVAAALLSACVRAELPRVSGGVAASPPVVQTASSGPPAPEAPRWPPLPPGIESAFCLHEVVETLAEDACYVLPDRPTTTLLIYLPGLMPPNRENPEKRKVETVVANAARRAGVAALVPRGPTRAEMVAPERDPMGFGPYRSWPTGDTAYRRFARRLVDRIVAARRALEELIGRPFDRVYLGGSSAGAYFVAHLALRGDFDADGYVVISGGSSRPSPRLSELPKRPLYVGYGDGDTVGPKAEALAAQVRAAGWDVLVRKHHTGHGSREVYLDEAFAFFDVVHR